MLHDNISVAIKKNYLLENVHCEIPTNEITAIIGPNGSGKSTLVKTVSGILPLIEGSVSLSGKKLPLYSRKQLAKKIAYLAQTNIIPDDMTVKSLVSLGRYCHQPWWCQHQKRDEAIVNEALAQVNLDHLSEKKLSSLSGGQQQRAYLAMSLAQQTPILILDEPTKGLDITQQYSFLNCLQILKTHHKKTIVMVMHDIQQAYHFSDYCLAMKNGKLVAQGNTRDTLTQALVRDVFDIDQAHPFIKLFSEAVSTV